jgi:hypothetical protein
MPFPGAASQQIGNSQSQIAKSASAAQLHSSGVRVEMVVANAPSVLWPTTIFPAPTRRKCRFFRRAACAQVDGIDVPGNRAA